MCEHTDTDVSFVVKAPSPTVSPRGYFYSPGGTIHPSIPSSSSPRPLERESAGGRKGERGRERAEGREGRKEQVKGEEGGERGRLLVGRMRGEGRTTPEERDVCDQSSERAKADVVSNSVKRRGSGEGERARERPR
eukprot:scaffold161817_cov23-Tisochrysis_lutea.AAC.1